ncbi:MAG: TatD family hydrolase [Gammaproteobacteria bacterium]|nr:TatD family hydrolase [Gammaproteobacteria bacterium]
MYELIDSHCHIDFPVFEPDREAIIAQAKLAGLRGMVVPGTVASGWPTLVRLAMTHRELWPALGLHPMFMAEHKEAHLHELEKVLGFSKPVAIGEIGLDKQVEHGDYHHQEHFFKAQLAIAKLVRLPVLLHVRKTHDEVLHHLRFAKHETGGIVHAFNGSEQQAQQYIDLGFKLGFGGAITFPRALKLQRLAGVLPASALVLETDAPDMKPEFETSERNTPLNLPRILEFIAHLRQDEPAALAKQTTQNVRDVLHLTAA